MGSVAHCKAFNNKENRASLFAEFMKCGKDLAKMELSAKRKLIKAKLAQSVYRPKTEAELLDRYKDQSYVDLVKKEAEKRKRVTKDPLALNDGTRTQYWVLWVCQRGCSEHQFAMLNAD